ncbi:hypothetical protein [Pseudomonas sp. BP8]|uniref:hypothetical protein n=1 Tax=Pseudomonas sp. BP8 TaxID=2817864 RepID=UPI001AE989CF|nr:hypothetical protein [Pseudomonas sp. BP8]MBP2260408.1 hypothetical protein [Pseudomonas sp. BP8]HDS1737776.1 hypothetical protein [Pseudomonas putida]
MRIVSDETKESITSVKATRAVSQESHISFATVLNDSMQTSKPKGEERQDEIGSILRYARQSEGYAEGSMLAYLDDIGGPLIDVSNPDVVRFSLSGEIVTPESMLYYREIDAIAKRGRLEIYNDGKARGEATETTFERYLEFNSSLPERFKQMANITY